MSGSEKPEERVNAEGEEFLGRLPASDQARLIGWESMKKKSGRNRVDIRLTTHNADGDPEFSVKVLVDKGNHNGERGVYSHRHKDGSVDCAFDET